MNTCVKRTLGSVPLVSVLKRFDCTVEPPQTATSLQRPLSSVPKVAVVERFNCISRSAGEKKTVLNDVRPAARNTYR